MTPHDSHVQTNMQPRSCAGTGPVLAPIGFLSGDQLSQWERQGRTPWAFRCWQRGKGGTREGCARERMNHPGEGQCRAGGIWLEAAGKTGKVLGASQMWKTSRGAPREQ